MRELTSRKRPFALSYMTYSRERKESHGIVSCEHALLIKAPKPAAATPSDTSRDYMLTYRDQDTQEVRQFWQPLLLSFNHQNLESIE